jgi:hypothetical protein
LIGGSRKACRRAAAGYAESVKFARAVGWPSLLAAAAYLAAFGSVVYVGDFRFSEGVSLLAPLLFGLAVRQWWAIVVPLLILVPLPALLAVFPPGDDSEFGVVGIAFLVAFWTAGQCVLTGVGVLLGRGARSVLARTVFPRKRHAE